MSRSNPRRARAPRSHKAAALSALLLCLFCFAGCQQADRAEEAPASATAPAPISPTVEPTTGTIGTDAINGEVAKGQARPTDGPSGYAPSVEKPRPAAPARVAPPEPEPEPDTDDRDGDFRWEDAPPPPPALALAQEKVRHRGQSVRNADPSAARLGDALDTQTAELEGERAWREQKRDATRRPMVQARDAAKKIAVLAPEPEEALAGDIEAETGRDGDAEEALADEEVADKSVTKSRSRVAANLLLGAPVEVVNEEAGEGGLEDEKPGVAFGSKHKPKPRQADKNGRFRQNLNAEFSPSGDPLSGFEDGFFAGLDGGEVAEVRPTEFLPRTCYVSNTYRGNRAAHVAALSALDARLSPAERPYARAGLPPQAFDGPDNVGISLSTRLDRAWLDTPGRVYLQVGLRGSDRHGWRRPPLDLVLVLDAAVANDEAQVLALTTGLMRRLGPQDRLGVLVAGGDAPQILSPVDTLRAVRPVLTHTLGEGPLKTQAGDGVALAAGLARAGELLDAAAEGQARVPGTQVVLLAVSGDAQRTEAARIAAHQLTLQGAVVSVAALDGAAEWWTVADAGHGSLHRGPQVEAHLDAELEGLSRVVARLLRLDIKLGENVSAVRVLGAEVLGAREVARVKAREEAVDARLAKTTGLKADRGDDGEGIQIVVPWFAGGDSHVVLVELWVDEPGPVAEVTLKYKDMVALSNGTARSSVALPRTPHNLTASQLGVRRNVAGFKVAEALQGASLAAARGASAQAKALLRHALPPNPTDRAVVLGFLELLDRRPAPLVAEALQVAAERRYGAPAEGARP